MVLMGIYRPVFQFLQSILSPPKEAAPKVRGQRSMGKALTSMPPDGVVLVSTAGDLPLD